MPGDVLGGLESCSGPRVGLQYWGSDWLEGLRVTSHVVGELEVDCVKDLMEANLRIMSN